MKMPIHGLWITFFNSTHVTLEGDPILLISILSIKIKNIRSSLFETEHEQNLIIGELKINFVLLNIW